MFADTMDSVFDLIEPHGVLSEDVLFGLEQMFGGRMISEIANLKAHELTAEIITRRGALFPKDVASLDAATALLEVVRRLEIADMPVPPEAAHEAAPAPAPERTSKSPEWCRKQLLSVANDSYSLAGDLKIGRTVKSKVQTVAGDIKMNEAIVLQVIESTAGDIKGIAYMPPGATVSTVAGDVDADIRQLSWERLYDKAVEFGLV